MKRAIGPKPTKPIRWPWIAGLCTLLVGTATGGWAAEPPTTPIIHHDLRVELDPEISYIRVTDHLRFPASTTGTARTQPISLHRAMLILPPVPEARTPQSAPTSGVSVVPGAVPLSHYNLPVAADGTATLRYEGAILHPATATGQTPGLISSDGMLLSGATAWVPMVDDALVTFTVTISMPKGWEVISQGEPAGSAMQGDRHVMGWSSRRPQDEIYLVGGPLNRFQGPVGRVRGEVYLRQADGPADPVLAQKYLTATARYVTRYARQIGPYPYAKFALVENFWETGYGMPSFTLLGPTVIRLPFIVDTAFPHEILHNWWGNGVFVDPDGGNWAEGLTVYMADHDLAAEKGRGPAYRRDALVGYRDYVRAGADFPLAEFRGRHNRATQAVGYGKGMMLFHMLRVQLGAEAFDGALRQFYRIHRFKRAGYDDLKHAFSRASGRNLERVFHQWIAGTGAPTLTVDGVTMVRRDDGFQLTATLRQQQPDADPYLLYVPVVVTLADGTGGRAARTERRVVRLDTPEKVLSLSFPTRPTRIEVDPDFEVFRTVATGEVPPAFSNLFGATTPLIVLPSAAPEPTLAAYRALAARWTRKGGTVHMDTDLTELPAPQPGSIRPIWILGWQNRFLEVVGTALATTDTALLTTEGLLLPNGTYPREGHGMAVALHHPDHPNVPLGWLAADPAVVADVGRKLPHYSRYGYVVFAGAPPVKRTRGTWPGGDSPLAVTLPPPSSGGN